MLFYTFNDFTIILKCGNLVLNAVSIRFQSFLLNVCVKSCMGKAVFILVIVVILVAVLFF